MSKTLEQLLKDVDEVKKNTVHEIAKPIQELVNMVNAGEIESIVMVMRTINQFGIDPYTNISVKINSNEMKTIGILGLGNSTKQAFFDQNLTKNIPDSTKEKLLDINRTISSINHFLKDNIPANQPGVENHWYVYSVSRRDIKANWTEEEAKKWPMLPTFLEGLVDLQSKPQKTPKMK